MFLGRNKLHKFIGIAVFLLGFFIFVPVPASADTNLTIRSVDVMKWTKDTLNNKPSDAQIDGIVSGIVNNLHPTHIAISVPLDDTSDFSQKWADAIHRHGVKVIFRGTWEGIEGIYNVTPLVGKSRIPAGTLQSAATDGTSTWLGKSYQYVIGHPGLFASGDIWAPLPERTEGIFQDSTSFLSYGGLGIQSNYATFFNDLKKVSDLAFAKIGVNVTTGYTANNFSEAASTWLPQSVFDTAGVIAVDHYGITHTPQEMDADIRKIYALHGKKVFLEEWGDYWDTNLSDADRAAYLNSMYAVFQKLVNDNILIGFNYWGGWENNLEGILQSQGSNQYTVNSRGVLLANFFAANGSQNVTNPLVPTPVPTPTPIPTPPTPVPVLPSITTNPTPVPSPTPITPQPTPALPTTNTNNETHTPVATAPLFRDGTLVNDHGTIYVIEYGSKTPLASMDVFNGLDYKLSNVVNADTSTVPASNPLYTPIHRHPRGTLVLDSGTVYFLGKDQRYPFTSAEVFLSWDNKFKDIVKANSFDLSLPVGPAATKAMVLGASFTPLPFGTFVRGSAKTVYLIVGERKAYPFTSDKLYEKYGFSFDQVMVVRDDELANYQIESP